MTTAKTSTLLISQHNLTTVAVPQYGKYKVRAAHTEVKTTLANVHSSQALYMTDQNKYAVGLEPKPSSGAHSNGYLGLGLVLPATANANSSNFVYGYCHNC